MTRRTDCLIQLFDEVESLMSGLMEFQFPAVENFWSPATDVFTTADEVGIILELPGVPSAELKVAVSPVIVEISGVRPTPQFFSRALSFYEMEIPHGAFRKRIALPCRVDVRRARADFQDGLLTLHLPRAVPPRIVLKEGN